MASKLYKYADFVAKNERAKQDPAAPFALLHVPESAGGSKTKDNRCYASAAVWIRANNLWFDALDAHKTKAAAKRHAAFVLREMAKNPALKNEDLEERCRGFAVSHGNASPQIYTIFSTEGGSATGTTTQLASATGLHRERVRDIVSGRRRYSHGWCASEEEARRGKGTPTGRPKKEAAVDFFFDEESTGAPIF